MTEENYMMVEINEIFFKIGVHGYAYKKSHAGNWVRTSRSPELIKKIFEAEVAKAASIERRLLAKQTCAKGGVL